MTILKSISMMIGLLLLTITMAFADAKPHKIGFCVDESDPNVMNMALNNVQNVSNYYAGTPRTSLLSSLPMSGHNL